MESAETWCGQTRTEYLVGRNQTHGGFVRSSQWEELAQGSSLENDFLHSELHARRRCGMYDFTTYVPYELIILANFCMRSDHSDPFSDVRSNLDERKLRPWNTALHSLK
jgi:hypothetical protein